MKIAIKANRKRGEDIIALLENLGGINKDNWCGDGGLGGSKTGYYIKNNYIEYGIIPEDYKQYTIEEFEEEFPFKIGDEVIFPVKIGWASGKITGLTYVENQLKYEVDSIISGYHYIEPHKLSLYPMKEERNVTLTLDKAKEWYKKGGELREIALQAFTEKELNPLPRSWKEFCTNYPIQNGEAIIDEQTSQIRIYKGIVARGLTHDKNIYPSEKSAEAHLAMIQLEQLRNCWRQGWVQTPANTGYRISKALTGGYTVLSVGTLKHFLSFPTKEMAEEFLGCFRKLIEQAGDLI